VNYPRLIGAAFVATLAYFICGFLVFAVTPLADEFRRYPALYRPMEGIQSHMPAGLAATLIAILVLAVLYAAGGRTGSGAVGGLRFGMLIGVFVVCGFVLHNYANLNIGLRITLLQAVAFFIEWTIVGLVIGLVYRPAKVTRD